VGTLAATQAGCPAVQVRQSLTEACSQESVAAMQRLEVVFFRGPGTGTDIVVELDVKQPSPSNKPCDHDAPGGVPIACIQEGPITSRVLRGSGKLVRGTLLAGHVWFHPPSGFSSPLTRWTEATLPDESKHPVCIETDLSGVDKCPNGAVVNCAAVRAGITKRWSMPLNP
jgi:hypothetical protein